MRTTHSIAMAATLLLAGCGDSSEPGGPPDNQGPAAAGLALSAPVPPVPSGGNPDGNVVFVSITPGSVARAASVQIKASGIPASTLAALDGGFDPVAVPGEAGDRVEVMVTDSSGGKTTVTGTARQGARPRVVRTSPAPRQTDVPLNAIIKVVFSAPMTLESVADGVHLMKESTVVPTTLVANGSSGLAFDLQPSGLLEPGANYRVVIEATVKDVMGTSLGEAVPSDFTTAVVATGTVRVITQTTGEGIDPDGYFAWVLVPAERRPIGVTDTLLVPGWPVGDQSVIVDGISVNCLIDGGSGTQGVRVSSGGTATVTFTVRCARGSRLTVVTSTSGSDLDPDGYWISLGPNGYWISLGREYVPVATNGSYLFPDVLPGTYSLVLEWVSPNCSHDRVNFPGFHEPVTMAGADATATFNVTCLPVRQLAAVAGDGQNSEIYLINSNGVGQTRLTSNAALDNDPAWSPDGSQIVFSSDRGGNREIYVMNADGSGEARLTSAEGADTRPAWSPDGNRIAFVSDRDGNAEVYVMNADGTAPVRLTSDTGDDLDPTWSPDGRRIAFSSRRSGSAHLYVMNADGSGQVQITFNQGALVGARQPAWSPDGATIVFVGEELGELAVLHRVAPDGSNEVRLSSPELMAGAGDPAWSADGRQLAASAGACQGCGVGIQLHRTSDGAMTGALIYDGAGATLVAGNAAWRP
jgi:WD40 repeat protein